MTLPERADAVVVGGGITGTSLAYHLARRGLSTILLERERIASGPTGRSTAIVRAHYSQPLLVRMAGHGLEVYRDGADGLGPVGSFTQTGVLWLVGVEDRAALEQNVAMGRSEGAELELLDPAGLRAMEPRIDANGVAAACWEPRAGHCDPYAAAATFAQAAAAHGAVVAEQVPVERLEDGIVHTAAGSIRADAIVIAAGPWSPRLLAPSGFRLPMVPARAQVGRYRVPDGWGATLPAVADLGPLQFYVKQAEGPFLEVGTLDPGHTDTPIDPNACPEGAEPEVLEAFVRSLTKRFPGLEGGHWRGAWSGVYDVTPDWQPVVGAVPAAGGLYVAAGLSGHGFKLAPAIALALSGLIAHGAWDAFDLSLFDPQRFDRGQLVSSRYGYSVVG